LLEMHHTQPDACNICRCNKCLATCQLATRTGKKEKYLREQISKRANRLAISAEAALIVWARQYNIGSANYLRKLSPNIQEEVRSALPSVFVAEKRQPKGQRPDKERLRTNKTNVRLAIDHLIKDEDLRGRCRDLLLASRHFDRVFREATTVLDDRLKRISGINKMKRQDLVGKALRALANDPELARLSGINSDRYIMYAFAIGSFLAAVAAIMISFDTDMAPTMGFNALVMGVIAVIVGGIGSLPGAALGGLLIGLAQNLGVWQLPSKWQDTIAFVILILFLLFRPYGILGKKPQKAHI